MYFNRLATDSSSTITCQLDSHHKKDVEENRSYLKQIIEIVIWLCKQGLAFRGHNRENFLEFFDFQSKYQNESKKYSSKAINYLSPNIQNEIIEIISQEVLNCILPNSSSNFAIMIDKTMDISRNEQISVC